MPTARGMDSLRALRDIKYYETLYELIAKQYEAARIDESKDSSLIQVLDTAVEPEIKTRPKRAVMVMVSALVAFFAAVLWIWGMFLLNRAQGIPEQGRRIQALREALMRR